MDLENKSAQEYILLISQLTEPELYFAPAVAEKLQNAGVKVSFLPLKLFSIRD